MKLLIATGVYPPDIGGPATYTIFLEKHLKYFNVEFEVLPYKSVKKYPKIFRHIVYTYKLIVFSRGVDVLYALDTVSVGMPVRIASFITRKSYLLRVPGDYAWEQGQQRFGITETLDEFLDTDKKYPFFVHIMQKIQTKVAKEAKHVIVPSDYMKHVVEKWGVPKNKISRVYSVLKPIEVKEPKATLRQSFGYRDFIITTSCRLVPWKGVSALIDIINTLRSEGNNISLEIIGDGVMREALESQSRKLKLGAYVNFKGRLDREEMGKRIKASDIFILNTSYEGFSHQLLETMDLGTPIITTSVGGNPELITNDKTGLLVPYDDKKEIKKNILKIYKDGVYGETLALYAKERAKEFTEDISINEFIKVLHSLWKF